MRDDPCFDCLLPDCDDRSLRCIMRSLANSYDRKVRHDEKHLITDQERRASRFIFNIWNIERNAEAAEGIRPFNRWKRAAAREVEASP